MRCEAARERASTRWSAPVTAYSQCLRNVPIAQIGSSSEDAADDKDTDFEPDAGIKRKPNTRLTNTKSQKLLQPLTSKPGNAADVSSWSMNVRNCVAFPRDISAEMAAFLEKNGFSMSMYLHTQEVKLCGQGTVTMNDTCLIISKKQGARNPSIPNEYFWDQIQFIKSTMGSDGTRHICFQNENGLIITFDMDGLLGDYSRFRT
jgi:hypothetical protein